MELEALFPELSAKQVDILKAVAHGFTNEYIGERYNTNVRTVEYHVSQIIEKLDVRASVSHNPRTRLAHVFYRRVHNAAEAAFRGS